MKAVNYKQIKNMWKKDTGYDPTFNLLYILEDIIVNMINTIAISTPNSSLIIRSDQKY